MKRDYQVTVWTENDLRLLNQIVSVLSYRNTVIEQLNLKRSETDDTCKFTLRINTGEEHIGILIRQIERKIGILKASATSWGTGVINPDGNIKGQVFLPKTHKYTNK